MILWMNGRNQDNPSAKGLQFEDEPQFFDFETEEKWRVKLQEGYKNALPLKKPDRPGKILEFKRKSQESN